MAFRLFLNVLWLTTVGFVSTFTSAWGQRWFAEVSLNLNHDLYAYERITHATLTFSGQTVTGTSPDKYLSFEISGDGPLTGEIRLTIKGVASQPYDSDTPPELPLSITLQTSYDTPCITGFIEGKGATPLEQIFMWITIYPQLTISDFLQECEQLTLISQSCAPIFSWEVSDNLSGDFITIPGKSGSTITITREELVALGFTNPYGRKYFRASGKPNTASLLQPVDIYYPGPSVAVSTINPLCHDGVDGSISVEITSSLPAVINDYVVTLLESDSGNPLAQESIHGNDFTFTDLRAGSFLITVENNTSINEYGNCWETESVVVTEPGPVTMASAEISNYNGYGVSCAEAEDGEIVLTPAGGTGSFTAYEWMPTVATSHHARQLAPGVYNVKVKDSNECWSETFSYTVSAPAPLEVGLVSAESYNGFDVSCHDKSDGGILSAVSGGVPNYSYAWADGPMTPTRADLSPSAYTLTVTDANGCRAEDSMTLLAPPPITFNIAEITGITCYGDQTGALIIQSFTNTIGEITVQWSSGETSLHISNKPAGIYTSRVTDQQGCNATQTYELAQPDSVTARITLTSGYNGAPISCNGSSDGTARVDLFDPDDTAIAGDHFVWYRNGEIFSSGMQSSVAGLSAGYYRVEATYRMFCKTEATLALADPPPVSVTISNVSSHNGVPISCHGANDGHLRAHASGGTGEAYSFSWSTGTTTPDLVNVGAGTFHVTAFDENGCPGSTSIEISDPDPLSTSITVISPASCAGSGDAQLKAVANGGTAPYHFQWTTGQTSQHITDVPRGHIAVTTTDVNGCETNADTLVSEPPPLIAAIVDRSDFHGFGVSCKGASDGYLLAGASGGTGSYSYRWQESNNRHPMHSQLAAGEYDVLVTDDNGCVAHATAVVNEPETLTLHITTATHVSCHGGNDGAITLHPGGGVGPYRFAVGDQWLSDNTADSLVADTYTLRTTDGNGCEATTERTLFEPDALAIQFTGIAPSLCREPVGQATADVSGGTGLYRFSWTDGSGQVVGTNSTITGLSPGIYTLIVNDENQCQVSEVVGIPSADGPAAEITSISPARCSDSADGSAALAVNGNGPFSFQWPDGSTNHVSYHLSRGPHLVQIRDANGCVTVATVHIEAPDTLMLELVEANRPQCHGDCNGSLTVAAHGGNGTYAYEWTNAVGPTLDHLCAGFYRVTVSDSKACTATAEFILEQPEPLTIKPVREVPPLCHGSCDGVIEVASLGGSGAAVYEWSNGTSGPLLGNACAGEYSLTVRDENDCVTTAFYTLPDAKAPTLELGGPVVLCSGQTHVLDPGPQWQHHTWGSDQGVTGSARTLTISQPGRYWLEVTDVTGCRVRDTFLLRVSDALLKVDFLLTSEAYLRDTVVAIDITWPLPENTHWMLPEEMIRLGDHGDVVYGQFTQPGIFGLGLTATLGACHDHVIKYVTILDSTKSEGASGRVAHTHIIREFGIYPNPNRGQFQIVVLMSEPGPIRVTIFDVTTSRVVARYEADGGHHYEHSVDLGVVTAGAYTLRLEYRGGTVYRRMIVR